MRFHFVLAALALAACADGTLPPKSADDPSNAKAQETPFDPKKPLPAPPPTAAQDAGPPPAHEHHHHGGEG